MGYIEQALLQQTLCKQRQSVILPLLQHSRDCSQEHVITTTEFCEENKLCVWGIQTALHCGGSGYTSAIHLPRSCDCKEHLVTKDGHCRGRLQYSVGTDTDTERGTGWEHAGIRLQFTPSAPQQADWKNTESRIWTTSVQSNTQTQAPSQYTDDRRRVL